MNLSFFLSRASIHDSWICHFWGIPEAMQLLLFRSNNVLWKIGVCDSEILQHLMLHGPFFPTLSISFGTDWSDIRLCSHNLWSKIFIRTAVKNYRPKTSYKRAMFETRTRFVNACFLKLECGIHVAEAIRQHVPFHCQNFCLLILAMDLFTHFGIS